MNTKKADAGNTAAGSGGSQAAADVAPDVAPEKDKFTQQLTRSFERLPAARGLVVAFSGGVDSHVLLVCASAWCLEQKSETSTTLPLRAHHVNHGLQSGSADWAAHCDTVCQQLQIELTISQVSVDLQSGLSPEDAARRARYEVLQADLRADEVLLMAHHADDQAETLLLQLFRGAGVNGLAAMPDTVVFGEGHLARPMLQVTSDSVREFAKARSLNWIEDPSNADNGYDRNLLRNQVMPLLKARWPSIATSVSRSASHCAEAAEVNRIFASGKLGEQIKRLDLPIPLLQSYTSIEKKVLLRTWIEHHGFSMPSAARLDHLVTDLLDAGYDSAGELWWGNSAIRKYRDCLYLGAASDLKTCNPFSYNWTESQQTLTIQETGQVLTREDIPEAHRAVNGDLVVRSRQGGEQIRLSGHCMHKSVKKLFQECAIPPWQRERLPFIYSGGKLIGIVGIGFTD